MEHIKPIFVWSNIFGLYPFLGEKETHKTRKRLLILWCCIVLLFQITDCGLIITLSADYLSTRSGGQSFAFVGSILVQQVNSFVSNLTPRLLCLRGRRLRSFLCHLRNFDSLMGPSCKHSKVTKKIYLAFAAGTIWGLIEIGLMFHYVEFTSKHFGYCMAYLWIIFRGISHAHEIFIHMSIYAASCLFSNSIKTVTKEFPAVVGEYQRPRRVGTGAVEDTAKDQFNQEFGQELDRIKTMLNHVNWACDDFIRAYSPVIFMTCLMKLVSIIADVFRGTIIVMGYTKNPYSINYPGAAYFLLQLLFSVGSLFFIFHFADKPVQKMVKLKKVIADCNGTGFSPSNKADISSLVLKVDADRVRFSAGGLLGVGKHLIPGIIGTVITYIVILFQS